MRLLIKSLCFYVMKCFVWKQLCVTISFVGALCQYSQNKANIWEKCSGNKYIIIHKLLFLKIYNFNFKVKVKYEIILKLNPYS